MIMPLGGDMPDLTDEQARWRDGQEDPLRLIRRDSDDRGHSLQYVVIGHPRPWLVVGTGNATDEQVRAILPPGSSGLPVERFNRCPTCGEWSPCRVRTAWRDKIPAGPDPNDAGAEHHVRVEVTAEPDEAPRADLLATARNAVDAAVLDLKRTGHRNVERAGALAQAAALTSIAESFAVVRAAVVAATPGVLRTLQATGKALSEAYSGQTAALQRIADALEASGLVVGSPGTPLPLADIETNDLEALARSADVDGTKHGAEQLRMRLDRIRELCDMRSAESDDGGTVDIAEIWPREILAILDGPPGGSEGG